MRNEADKFIVGVTVIFKIYFVIIFYLLPLKVLVLSSRQLYIIHI